MRVLLLRLDAPMMSFGGPMVDQHGVTDAFPGLSMLTGLLANALGYEHAEHARTQRLQERIRYAVRRDVPGERFIDYQTVDLGQDFLSGTGWTTKGVREDRAGAFSDGTHIRLRHYIADACYTVALTLTEPEEAPTVADLEDALREPARPVFLGRKTCLPASSLVLGIEPAEALRDALAETALAKRARRDRALTGWWPREERRSDDEVELGRTDARDWQNQIHVGRRVMLRGTFEPRNP